MIRSSGSVSMAPRFAFNADIDERTIDSPISVAARWAEAYPAPASPLRAVDGRATLPLLNLAQGVPGIAPPDYFLDRVRFEGQPAQSAPKPHLHGYTHVLGERKLREALAAETNDRYRSAQSDGVGVVRASNVAITAGCNLAFCAALGAIAKQGDSVVLPYPWYFNHYMTLTAMGIDVVPLPCDGPHATVRPESVASCLDEAPKNICAVIIVTPNNPTGAIYAPETLAAIADVCHAKHVAMLLDETYRDFVLDADPAADGERSWTEPHALFHDTMNGRQWLWSDTVIHLISFSKSFAIPGHRLGGVVCAPELLEITETAAGGKSFSRDGPIAKVLDNMQVCAPRADTQRAIAWALGDETHRTWRLAVANQLFTRLTIFRQALERPVKLESTGDALSPSQLGWELESMGAYYAFVKHPFNGIDSRVLAYALATLFGVVALPSPCAMRGASLTPRLLLRASKHCKRGYPAQVALLDRECRQRHRRAGAGATRATEPFLGDARAMLRCLDDLSHSLHHQPTLCGNCPICRAEDDMREGGTAPDRSTAAGPPIRIATYNGEDDLPNAIRLIETELRCV